MKRGNTTRIVNRQAHIGFRTSDVAKAELESLCKSVGRDLTDAMNDVLPDAIHRLRQESARRAKLLQQISV